MEILGVPADGIRAVVHDLRRRLKSEKPAAVLQVAHGIIASNTVEGRQVAYEILSGHKKTMETLKLKDVEALGRGIDNWVSVDTFSVLIAGPCWREGQVPDSAVRRWTRSKDRWWRRTAVVSTVALNLKSRGGRGDVGRTIDICSRLASDDDDMVAKGLSWALRELSKREKAPVRRFLREHDDVLPARVKREVKRKLATGRKN
jgi:3-methyladenine DNA glycosylase AlkD